MGNVVPFKDGVPAVSSAEMVQRVLGISPDRAKPVFIEALAYHVGLVEYLFTELFMQNPDHPYFEHYSQETVNGLRVERMRRLDENGKVVRDYPGAEDIKGE